MFGGRYFGARHFGRRYYGKSGLTVQGIFLGGRYFGSRYFGEAYFSPNSGAVQQFAVAQTNVLAAAGSVAIGSATMAYGTDVAISQSGALGLIGSLGVSGALSFDNDTDFAVTPPLEVGLLTGALTVAGSITITTGAPVLGSYWGGRHFGKRHFGGRYFGRPPGFSLVASAALALSGTANVAGGIATTIGIDPSPLVLSGSMDSITAGVLTESAAPPPVPLPNNGGGGGGRRQTPPHIIRQEVREASHIEAQNRLVAEAIVALVAAGEL